MDNTDAMADTLGKKVLGWIEDYPGTTADKLHITLYVSALLTRVAYQMSDSERGSA